MAFLFINATAYETAIYAEEGVTEEHLDEDIHDSFGRLDAAAYPNMFSMMDLLTSGTGQQRFSFGLRLMIEGLLHVPPPDIPWGYPARPATAARS